MSKIRVYIVEDEPLIAATIESSLLKEGFDVVGQSDDIGKAFFEIDDLQPDFVFLDIFLNDGDHGLKLGKKLNEKSTIPFIYLTSYSDQATVRSANETNPAGYLLKPFKSKDLKVAIDLAMMRKQEDYVELASSEIFVKSSKKWIKLQLDDIEVVKALDTYSEIYTKNERFVVSLNLKKIEERLTGNTFMRIHRSYLVNTNAIESIEEDVVKVNEHLIPVSRSYKSDLLSKLNFL